MLWHASPFGEIATTQLTSAGWVPAGESLFAEYAKRARIAEIDIRERLSGRYIL
jgi:hypothetical protein